MKVRQKFYVKLLLLQIVIIFTALTFFNGFVGLVSAQEGNSIDTNVIIWISICAAVSVVGSAWAASNVIKTVGTAAVSALTENRSLSTSLLMFMALGETLAIFGFLIALLLWTKIP
ncbi:MAG: hypothetical protein GY870_07825 [archaeon]|nr:hypothetical protein [archaeon]